MDNIYLILVSVLAVLAIGDLIVGVSNDAVNFLNSAVGSKAIPFKTIMILASLGVAAGALFSSGLMEVARKGIFNPGEFYFDEIILIFTAVMLTDILLLDFFNTLGMPTSTTVSIVFTLLGAAVFMSIIKISESSGDFGDIVNYINTKKAIQIISGILLSVVVALTVGAIVQWFSRLFLTYEFEKKAMWVSALFGGIALSAITYFILMKGIKGTPFANVKYDLLGGMKIKDLLEKEVFKVVLANFLVWFGVSFALIKFVKANIYKVIIGTGTFALALAFAGNDLVNFIGVPIAAYQSYEAWVASGVAATDFSMGVLSSKVPTPTLLLILSGGVMVLTLWLSTKAKKVMKTELDLSDQNSIKERFQPNFLSKGIVKTFQVIGTGINAILPASVIEKIDTQFSNTELVIKNQNAKDAPSFDMLRACINLVVASILISVATSYKLPLSTTYVTFMVAMGTSLADRAWQRDSAVYRVAGMINVIGGWFLTALTAFIVSGIIVTLIKLGGPQAIAIILFIILLIIGKNYVKHKNDNADLDFDGLVKSESNSIKGVMEESTKNVIKVFKRVDKIYAILSDGLAKHDQKTLKKAKKNISRLTDDVEQLRENVFYFIKNLEESSLSASNFYIVILSLMQDITDDLSYIVKKSYKHVNNDHSKLKLSQVRDLQNVNELTNSIFEEAMEAYSNNSVAKINLVLENRETILKQLNEKINNQIELTRNEETSPKNTTLYFNILLKSKDLYLNKLNIMETFLDNIRKIES
ncbi:inorganic phosphate transporter [Flavobacteriaceae bacterium]|jgi:phosphate/sulfate permease|uniref:inorganic phosphate transporter n=1 Tax=Candidatus Arcticimaribacter forsetii TaxID=2820661 RepID=UPI002076E5E9|nr:inorganic phosphate transporter [Candidatus Arcticimaribacter forsetii]MDB2329536.1 inorganic phosphate transporter [Flavobacteriaceae bacterium]MDB2345340.1 inorganic phosphate transporter [Flavobacteriaceae bacterium]MDB2456560.1 inorganic phosphate transporter [Flavobacteriaceae bacterium]MDB4620904.1 inorganic phosphate transporter [Flavobacteriaceae bacterium]MDB4674354.1 inorganic phosphate transporter [Flavobacteriaceae bacterium]